MAKNGSLERKRGRKRKTRKNKKNPREKDTGKKKTNRKKLKKSCIGTQEFFISRRRLARSKKECSEDMSH